MNTDKEIAQSLRDGIVKFDGGNDFQDWKFDMATLLRLHELWVVVQTERAEDDEEAMNKDAKALAFIHAFVGVKVKPILRRMGSAHEAWHTLCERYERPSDAHILRVHSQLVNLKLRSGQPLAAHLLQVEKLVAELRAVGGNVEEAQLKLLLLNSLPSEYKLVYRTLASQLNELSFDAVQERLITEEELLKRELEEDAGNDERTPDVSFQVQDWHTCFSCGRRGHMAADCRARVGGDGGARGSSSHSRGFSRGRSARGGRGFLRGRGRARGGGGYRGRGARGGGAFGGRGRGRGRPPDEANHDAVQQLFYLSAAHEATTSDRVLLDSGASVHCTNKRAFFIPTTFRPTTEVIVGVERGRTLQVKGRGAISIRADNGQLLTIHDVLFIPEARQTLLSTTRLCSNGLTVTLDHLGATVSDREGRELLRATIHNGLPLLDASVQVNAVDNNDRALLDHCRLGHPGRDRQRAASGSTLSHACDVCCQAKATLTPMPKSVNADSPSVAKAPLEIISADLSGPVEPDFWGNRYLFAIDDNYTRVRWVYPLRLKSDALETFKGFHKFITKNTGLRIGTFHSDNGGEFTSSAFRDYLNQQGIRRTTTVPHTPAQNGITERGNRTLFTSTRAMRLGAGLPTTYWSLAAEAACYTNNRLPTAALKGRSPYEAWHGTKPNLDHLRVFGCPVFVRVESGKLHAKAVKGTFVGYPKDAKGYLVRFDDGRIIVTRDVTFLEGQVLKKSTASEVEDSKTGTTPSQQHRPHSRGSAGATPPHDDDDDAMPELLNDDDDDDVPAEPARHDERGDEHGQDDDNGDERDGRDERDDDNDDNDDEKRRDEHDDDDDDVPAGPAQRDERGDEHDQDNDNDDEHGDRDERDDDDDEQGNGDAQHAGRRVSARLQRTFKPTNKALDYYAANFVEEQPPTVREALDDQDWRKAMDEEMAAHKKNGTWSVVRCPHNVRPLPTKWVFKRKDDGRFKARLVARGDLQGDDTYDETYSPVARDTTIKVALALTAALDFHAEQMDVKTAYLNGNIDEEIYLRPPTGYEGDYGGNVLRLQKALYGLKQAGLRWHETITSYLNELNFKKSMHDPCLFIKTDGQLQALIALYVDDILLSCRTRPMLDRLKQQLTTRFDMTILGQPKSYLGMDITRDAQGIQLSQATYIDKVLQRFGMQNAKPQPTPCTTRPTARSADEQQVDPKLIREAIGALLYLARIARPDIAFAIGQLARFQADPGESHLRGIKRVLRYLIGTKHFSIKFPAHDEIKFIGYSDADYAGDQLTRRSTGGFIFMLNGAPICWRSKLQTLTALSTTESEYVGLTETAKEAIYLRRLLQELHIDCSKPTLIHEDNQAAIAITNNANYIGRIKHLDTKYHFIRQAVQQGQVQVTYCPTDRMLADLLTKPLARQQHHFLTLELLSAGALPGS